MSLSSQLLFFFSALGTFNCFLLSLYILLVRKPKQLVSYLLGALLLLTSIRVGVSCIYFFEKDIPRFFIEIGLLANLLIGPFLFQYIRSSLKNETRLSLRSKVYLAGFITVAVVFGILYPFSEYPRIWDYNIRYIIHSVLTLHCILSAVFLKPIWLGVFKKSQSVEPKNNWIAVCYLANILVFLGFVVSLKTTYVLGSVWFSVVFYGTLLLLAIKKKQVMVFQKPPSYKKIKTFDADKLVHQLETLMVEERLFKNSNLKLADVARELKITPNRLSQLLNDNVGKSFSLFLNEYRVLEAKDLLITSDNRYTIEAIGYESGFSSKSSFFSTFKKLTETTPTEFIKKSRSVK